jgi:polysaccharide export outer membrane protein
MIRKPSPPGRATATALAVLVLGALPLAAQEAATEPTPTLDAPDYVIGVEDQIAVAVWNEPELTRSQTVRPDWKITVALLGDIQAAGRTPRQLDDQITESLKKWVNDPEVTVVVEAINSFKVFMIGEFGGQGELILKRRTRILEAIAMKGGLTPYADKSNIQVVREENGRETRLRIDYKKLLSGDRPDLNIYLRPGDVLIAN